MHNRYSLTATAIALACAARGHAGFVGWAAASRIDGGTLFVDVVANFDSADDRVLNVFDAQVTAVGASFLQDSAIARKAWRPETGQSGADRDSFMTIGTADSGFGLAGTGTAGDPNFTSAPGAWNPTLFSAPSESVPPKAGWYAADPASMEAIAFDLDAIGGASWQGRQARYGVWVAHFAFDLDPGPAKAALGFSGSVGYKSTPGPGGAQFGSGSAQFAVIPAPGAVTLLAAAGLIGLRPRVRR